MRSVFLKIICVDLLLLSAVHAGTFTNNFSSSTPTGFTLNGGNRPAPNDTLIYPAIEGGILKLTYAENGETGSIVLDELDPGATNAGFTARFTVQIGGGSSTPADGWTLHFGSDIDSSSKFGEEGPGVPASGSGIDICFDTYDNGGGEAPAIDVKVNGVQVAHTPESVFFMLSDNFTNVFIQLNPNGTLNVSYKGQVIYTNLYLPGYAPVTGGRFAIGARTGGLNENNWFDDLGITTTVAGAPAAPTITAQTSRRARPSTNGLPSVSPSCRTARRRSTSSGSATTWP